MIKLNSCNKKNKIMTILEIKNNELKLIKNIIEENHSVRKVFGNLFKLTIPVI